MAECYWDCVVMNQYLYYAAETMVLWNGPYETILNLRYWDHGVMKWSM